VTTREKYQSENAFRSDYPLSILQERYWLLSLVEPDSPAYHLCSILRLSGNFNISTCRAAIDTVVNHHTSLRTVFPNSCTNPTAQLSIKYSIEPEVIDWTNFESDKHSDALTTFCTEQNAQPFNLSTGPLIKICIIQLGYNEYTIVCIMHRIIADEHSMEIFFKDLIRAYSSKLPNDNPIRNYGEFSLWQKQKLEHNEWDSHSAFWKNHLSGELPILGLYTDFIRPARTAYSGKTISKNISDQILRVSKALNVSEPESLYDIILSTYTLLLSKHAGQTDLIIGVPHSGRHLPEHSEAIGRFASFIPLRIALDLKTNFQELFHKIGALRVEALLHTPYPLEKIIDDLALPKDTSRHPLFQTTCALVNEQPTNHSMSDLRIQSSLLPNDSILFDFSLNVIKTDDVYEVQVKYNTSLFNDSTAKTIVDHFETLLDHIAEDLETPVGNISVLSNSETNTLLVERNNNSVPLPSGKGVHQLVEDQSKLTPDTIAVLCGEKALTYADLNSSANKLANLLIANNLKVNDRVAICMDRSVDLMVAILAILKSGAVYFPIDPAYPADRQKFMIEDAEIKVVITQKQHEQRLSLNSANCICIDDIDTNNYSSENIEIPFSPDRHLYMIFTSGSTGKPKGSLVYHHGFVNLLMWYTREFNVTEKSAFCIISSLSFDLTQKNLFAPLICGGKLVFLDTPHYDAGRILDITEKHSITTINCTPSAFYGLLADERESSLKKLSSLKAVFLGGEPISLSRLRIWTASKWCSSEIVNSYGPTECTDVCAYNRIQDPAKNTSVSVPIGKPVYNTQLYILDESRQIVPDGAPGELYIGGLGVGAGYVNRPELNQEKFIQNPYSKTPDCIYKTGDRVRYIADGAIDFLGRIDSQVKIRGYRIELDEITEVLLCHPEVKEGIVIAVEDTDGEKQLAGYVVWKPGASSSFDKLRSFLLSRLPDFMVPGNWIALNVLPLSPNGKVDRLKLAKSCKKTELQQSQIQVSKNSESLEDFIIVHWQKILSIANIQKDSRFFEIGGTSLKAIQFIAAIGKELGTTIPMVSIFEAPTVSAYTQYLITNYEDAVLNRFGVSKSVTAESVTDTIHDKFISDDDQLAIIGMAIRAPGADTIDEFWNNLVNGVESIRHLTDDELLAAGVPVEKFRQKDYVKVYAGMNDIESFDAAFFGISTREAQLMDPQHRAILECAYSALEHAGYAPDEKGMKVGVFSGVARDGYLTNNIGSHPELLAQTGDYSLMTGNEKDYPSTRVAYKLNLRGPALNIQTACSSSGIALHFASKSILDNECNMALVGGCRVLVPVNAGYPYVDGGTLSPVGQVRAFDADAAGMVRGSGVGFIVIKKLSKALADNDTVYSIIKSSAINNDGSGKAGFTAPSVAGQTEVIEMALTKAQISPETIGYVEAHGTGTTLGDPIEVSALSRAYTKFTQKKQFCAIGSVKTNIGHMDAGACVAGIIKATLCLYHGRLVPSLNFSKPNPQIDFGNSPFFVNTKSIAWENASTPRRAAVSSFGLGGSNVHIILEEAPKAQSSPPTRRWQIIPLSAKSEAALDVASGNLAAYLKSHPDISLADTAFTLQTGRRSFTYRKTIVCEDVQDAIKTLDSKERTVTHVYNGSVPQITFMFPGQGSQYTGMGKELYESEPVFRNTVDECAEILKPLLNVDIRTIIYPQEKIENEATAQLNQTGMAQPAIFTIEYATAKFWMSLGIEPSVLIGHSIGEYVAACISGIFCLHDALTVIAARARLMQSMPAGCMRAVRLSEEQVRPHLTNGVAIAAVNSPVLTIVSGSQSAIDEFDTKCDSAGIKSMPVHTSHAFHSDMMLPVLPPFIEELNKVTRNAPRITVISTLTGTLLTDKEAISSEYWANQLAKTVRFSTALQTVLTKNTLLIEIGPSTNLSTAARSQVPKDQLWRIINTLPHATENQSSVVSALIAVGKVVSAGVSISWSAIHSNDVRYHIGLPTYPFERKRFWIDPLNIPPPSGSPVTYINQASSFSYDMVERNAGMSTPSIQKDNRSERIIMKLMTIMAELSGEEFSLSDSETSFLELGMDSLLLTQATARLSSEFGVTVRFRQLVDDLCTFKALATFIDSSLAPDAFVDPQPSFVENQPQTQTTSPAAYIAPLQDRIASLSIPALDSSNSLAQLISSQIQLMSYQLQLLTGTPVPTAQSPMQQPTAQPVVNVPPVSSPAEKPVPKIEPATDTGEAKKFVGPGLKITKINNEALSEKQKKHLTDLRDRYTKKTAGSKKYTERHRAHLADPRAVSGFKPALKEFIYPIVVNKSLGCKLWDIDGNEYVDMLNGFGSNFFGHRAPFVMEAVAKQLQSGVEIGPQHPLAGELAEKLTDFLHHDRVAFCNTGSEAVLGAMRIARTVTGRNKIVMFVGAYHGIFDEVIVRGTKSLKSLPAAPGIQPGAVDNIVVLDYGTDETLKIIEERATEFAAILVEPVQSRLPEFQPKEFLQKIREITIKSGTALIFDEVVCGFRAAPRGAQEIFDIKADLATYGKVLGGGMNIGVIAGSAQYMDALDGGSWQYGDDSIPEVGVTYFAGTFVRHPPVLAAATAVVEHVIKEGPELYTRVNEKTTRMVSTINAFCDKVGAPIHLTHFTSVVRVAFTQETQLPELLFLHLRQKGIHIWDHRPVYMTAAHTDNDIDFIINTFKQCIEELQRTDFLPSIPSSRQFVDTNKPPHPDAKLGRNADGNPAWYIPDPNRPGKYVEIG
jgi:amino acid adenylation domain-containing protein